MSNVEAKTEHQNTFSVHGSKFILGATLGGIGLLVTACAGAIAYRYWGKCSQEIEDYPTIELTPGVEAYPDAKPAFERFDSEMESCSTLSTANASPKNSICATPTANSKIPLHGRQGSMHILACINDGFEIDLEDAEDVFFDDYGNVTELNRSVCFDYDDIESSSAQHKSQHNKKNVEFQAD